MVTLLPPSGEQVWIHIRAVRQLDKAGQPERSVGFIRDISAQKMAERALAESERKQAEAALQAAREASVAGEQPIQALALFYDFKDMTPIGAEGDQMVRNLVRRLVDVDLRGAADAAWQASRVASTSVMLR